jgi:Mlc titration factor MtfA (ptsG expression regulator)
LAKSPVILLLQPKIHLFLNCKFTYYQKLDIEQKRKFALRVGGFLTSTHFSGKEGFTVTENVKIYVSACAVQLTFGLEG